MTRRPARENFPRIASVEPRPLRAAAASRAWLGTQTWPAYGAAGITAAYGVLKAYWVFGGTALRVIAPLPADMIEKARSHTAPTWFVIADAVTVVLAAVGVFSPWRPCAHGGGCRCGWSVAHCGRRPP